MIDLSVFIVTYNSSSLLRSCLDSLRAQTLTGKYEVIVVDNASRDDSVYTLVGLINITSKNL